MKTLYFLLTISLGIVIILVMCNIANVQACTPYENCVKTLPHSATQTASFNGNHATYGIPYSLSNATLVASLLDIPARELIFEFNATDVGQLMVELPRGIIDSTRYGNDKPYLVFVGDLHSGTKRVQANEIQNTSSNRILIINFTKNDNEIGIVGTFFIENNSTAKIHNGYGAWSPLQQYEKGFDAQDIVCKNGFVLIIKSEDNSPACVKPHTAQKLVERGWTRSILSLNSNLDKESKITSNDTYLSQTVDEWKNKTHEQLNVYYEKYKDKFYTDLGSFLIKDEMKKELTRQKIQNIHDDFKVFPGMSLDSLPPHISYDAVVNATDGNSYLLLGGVFANKIESSPKIIKLVFDKNALHSLSTGNGPSYPDPSANAHVDNSTSQEKVQIAGTYIEDSDIPWSSVGTGNYGVIQIGLYTSVYHMIPDAQKYYTARAMQLIPFYVPVKILPPPSIAK